jgi:hypothetical protein
VDGKVASNIMDTARNTRQGIFIRAPFVGISAQSYSP